MKIVVLAGGISTEREVSLSSGTMVAQALRRKGHKVVFLDSFFGKEQISGNIGDIFEAEEPIEIYRVKEQAPDIQVVRKERGESGFGSLGRNVIEICKEADVVYMGLHGENGENGRMQALFDVLEIPYTGSGYLGSAMAMDKGVSKQALLQSGIRTPKGCVILENDDISVADQFGLPCVIKVCGGGSSIGVSIVDTAEERDRIIKDILKAEGEVLVEEYIKGREFTCGVLGDQALPPVEIIPKDGWYDYAHKYQAGWTEEICPARISEEETKRMQDAALETFKALKLEVYGRVDFLEDEEGNFWVLEANTLPGMTPTSLIPQEAAAVGIGYDDLCEKIIELSLKKRK